MSPTTYWYHTYIIHLTVHTPPRTYHTSYYCIDTVSETHSNMTSLSSRKAQRIEGSVLALFMPFHIKHDSIAGNGTEVEKSFSISPLLCSKSSSYMQRTPNELLQRGQTHVEVWEDNLNPMKCISFKHNVQFSDCKDHGREVVSLFETEKVLGSYSDRIDTSDLEQLNKLSKYLQCEIKDFPKAAHSDQNEVNCEVHVLENILKCLSLYIITNDEDSMDEKCALVSSERYHIISENLVKFMKEENLWENLPAYEQNLKDLFRFNQNKSQGYLNCFLMIQSITRVRLLFKNVKHSHQLFGRLANVIKSKQGENKKSFQHTITNIPDPSTVIIQNPSHYTAEFFHGNAKSFLDENKWNVRGSLLDDVQKFGSGIGQKMMEQNQNIKKTDDTRDQYNKYQEEYCQFITTIGESKRVKTLDDDYINSMMTTKGLVHHYEVMEYVCLNDIKRILQAYFHHLKDDHAALSDLSHKVKGFIANKDGIETDVSVSYNSDEVALWSSLHQVDCGFGPNHKKDTIKFQTKTEDLKIHADEGDTISYKILKSDWRTYIENQAHHNTTPSDIPLWRNVFLSCPSKQLKKKYADIIMTALNASGRKDYDRFKYDDFEELSFFVRFFFQTSSRDKFAKLMKEQKEMNVDLPDTELIYICNTLYTASLVTIQRWLSKKIDDSAYENYKEKLRDYRKEDIPKKTLISSAFQCIMGLHLCSKLPHWIHAFLADRSEDSTVKVSSLEFTVEFLGNTSMERVDHCPFKSLIKNPEFGGENNMLAQEAMFLCKIMVGLHVCNVSKKNPAGCKVYEELSKFMEDNLLSVEETADCFLNNLMKTSVEQINKRWNEENNGDGKNRNVKIMNGCITLKAKEELVQQGVLPNKRKKNTEKNGGNQSRKKQQVFDTNNFVSGFEEVLRHSMENDDITNSIGKKLSIYVQDILMRSGGELRICDQGELGNANHTSTGKNEIKKNVSIEQSDEITTTVSIESDDDSRGQSDDNSRGQSEDDSRGQSEDDNSYDNIFAKFYS